jgi:uncharacterized protein YbcC (UPF0753/DUF2309 family)
MTTSQHLAADRTTARVDLLVDVQVAAELLAPAWPLTDAVAVNPLGGVQHRGFDEAAALARRGLGARTHLSLADYRRLHRQGRLPQEALRQAIRDELPEVAALGRVDLGRVRLDAVDLVCLDLLEGPEAPTPVSPPTALQRRLGDGADAIAERIDASLTAWCATYAGRAAPERELYGWWRELVPHDRRLRSLVGAQGLAVLTALPEDAEDALAHALARLGIDASERADELRAQLVRVRGWAGYALWCDRWATDGIESPRIRLVELAAIRVALEAAVLAGLRAELEVDRTGANRAVTVVDVTALAPAASRDGAPLPLVPVDLAPTAPAPGRVAAVLRVLGLSREARASVAEVLTLVPEGARAACWLAAHERAVRDRLLALLSDQPAAPPPTTAPEVQLLTCIDVRSEGLRRHLEARGPIETFGVAGFFGIAARWQPLHSSRDEARAPVLLTPERRVRERPAPGTEAAAMATVRRTLTRRGGVRAAATAKRAPLAPFAFAEAAGWWSGAAAAARTFAPRRAPHDRRADADLTVVDLDAEGAGFDLEARLDLAEGLLRAVGLTERFAPLVVLCGHASDTANNPHAATLDCGACGGAPGGASARVAAAICNDPHVRAGLAARGIDVPAATWFVPAEHDTAADRVTLLDTHLVPAGSAARLDQLRDDLEVAGAALAAERAARLPGDPARVRSRGLDWAETRPEWGLARNCAFVIGPRSSTVGRDLGCRTFLHSYDAQADVSGEVLAAIMTAPLVVAQWINAQYYFSSVDPVRFGAGDKLLHNPVGGVGVTLGDGGDLAVGLPWQSVALGDQLVHEPVRLLALVEAPLTRVAGTVQGHEVLRELVGGRWITVVAREDATAGWHELGLDGTWRPWEPVSPAQPSAA